MYKPRKYQIEANTSVFNYFYSGKKGNPLVVAPTGSGKSIIIADFCKRVIENWNQSILIITHTKEIIKQDFDAIKFHCPDIEISMYSAGLKQKKISQVTVAGINSIYKKPDLFNDFDIVIVDECHTIPRKDGMYHTLFSKIDKTIIGFTATPYRLGSGYLHLGEDAFFDEIVYTITIKELQEAGYLCPLSTKGTKKKLDATGIKKQAGDFILKELSEAFDRELITADIIKELLLYKDLRKQWLVFAIDIDHAEHINDSLIDAGIKSAVVHSRMTGNRGKVIDDFKSNDYQCLVSVAVLTTGFDAPGVDLIALLRPTASPTLHVQIIGRGLRIAQNKDDCLILDFAGNIMRNGPIDAPVIKGKGKGGGEAVMKECPRCMEICYAATRECPMCKHQFQFKHNLQKNAALEAAISRESWYDVSEVLYEYFVGRKAIPMLKVIYRCGVRVFNEFICIEHGGYAAQKASHWWFRRCGGSMPETAAEALRLSAGLKTPVKILVDESGKYPSIKKQELGE